jgi:hypothetical protein
VIDLVPSFRRAEGLEKGKSLPRTRSGDVTVRPGLAALEDVLQGKVWAYTDKTRRRSKRQKDLADILRIIEAFPELTIKLPQSLREQMQEE